MSSVQGRKHLPGNVHLGPAHFQEAERSIGNEITLLTLGEGAAKLPQVKQAGPVHQFFFHLSVWTDHSKSTKQTYQHRSQISTVNMLLIFEKMLIFIRLSNVYPIIWLYHFWLYDEQLVVFKIECFNSSSIWSLRLLWQPP